MDERLGAGERRLVESAKAFARDVISPAAAQWEAARAQPREALERAGAAGLAGILVPEEWGGAGAGLAAMARVMEVLAAADMALAFGLVVHNNLAGAIARHGSAAQRQRYLADLVAARRIGAFLLTEPGAGSDAAAIATRARRDGGGWIIDGEKAWISNAATADVLSIYAQTDPAAGWRGIACFLVDAGAEGVERLAPYALMGGHALGTGGFRFAKCRVGAEALMLGPGEGFKAAMAGIDRARAVVAAMCCGMLRAGLDLAREHARNREAFGRKTIEFQGLQWMLAEVATELEASRLLTREAVRRIDAGEDSAIAAAHAKKFATRAAMRGLADCMQVMGAAGLRDDVPLGRHLAAAKMAQYLDGTTEIQNVVIARGLIKNGSL